MLNYITSFFTADTTSDYSFTTLKTPKETSSTKVTNASLFLYDIRTSSYVPLHNDIDALVLNNMFLVCRKDGVDVLVQQITENMNPIFNSTFKSLVWVWIDPTTMSPLYSCSIQFHGAEDFILFRDSLVASCYLLSGDNIEKMKENKQFVLDSYMDDIVMNDYIGDEEDEVLSEEEEEFSTPQKISSPFTKKDSDNEDDDDYGLAQLKSDDAQKNSNLAVGYKNNRSFVVRGNKIGVFKHTTDNQLAFAATINNISTPNGKFFSPHKIMLHDQDSSMLMMKPDDLHNIYKMDLEYGKVVEEWKVDDVLATQEILPDKKYAQMTGNQVLLFNQKTFIGINQNSIFRIDPRLAGSKRVEAESKQYAQSSRNSFNCGSTTGKGELAVGSKKGEIRLYNHLEKNAKTLFPGLGDAILGIDSTEDGKWILATCKSYLLLLNTERKDGVLGYQKSIGINDRNPPIRLFLKSEHIAWMQNDVSFTTARFNTGPKQEKSIVASTGSYLITWDFKKCVKGNKEYQIKEYQGGVVADSFLYGNEKDIVVALEQDIEVLDRTSRKSGLLTPAKFFKSRSSIVNSPF